MQKMSTKVIRSEEPKKTLQQLIQRCVDRNRADGQPLFSVGLSGGSIPSVLAEVLPQLSSDFAKWRLFFCDERLVPFEDPESTCGVYRREVMPRVPALAAEQLIAVNPALSPQSAAEDYERAIRRSLDCAEADEWPRFDLLLLGMGPDGHTCSLFPNHALLQEKRKWVSFLTDSPKPPPSRVTLTLPVLLKAKCVVFYSTGAGKADTLRRIFVDAEPLPAGLVRPEDGDLYWVVDGESGRLIPDSMLTKMADL